MIASDTRLRRTLAYGGLLLVATVFWSFAIGAPQEQSSTEPALYRYLRRPDSRMICYTPSRLDPRMDENHLRHPTSELRKDLAALRPVFDGIILYGYHRYSTGRLVGTAVDLGFRAIILGIWQPRDFGEVAGVADIVRAYHRRVAIGVIVGNEGITFGRYEPDDVRYAAEFLRTLIPSDIPIATSEPWEAYDTEFALRFGDFLAPNIHPVFKRPELGPAEAARWSRQEAFRIARAARKPVLLKETGFPHGGGERFSPRTQRLFWEAYLSQSTYVQLDNRTWLYFGAVFEAFDQPWKAQDSGLAVEAFWGLLSEDRRPYPAFEVCRPPQ